MCRPVVVIRDETIMELKLRASRLGARAVFSYSYSSVWFSLAVHSVRPLLLFSVLFGFPMALA